MVGAPHLIWGQGPHNQGLDGFHPNLSELNIFNFEMPVLIHYWIVYINIIYTYNNIIIYAYICIYIHI